MISRYNDKIFVKPGESEPVASSILQKLYGDKWNRGVVKTKLAEQGFVSQAGNYFLISDAAGKFSYVDKLGSKNHRFIMTVATGGTEFGLRMENGHIDTEIQIGAGSNGIFMVVTSEYDYEFSSPIKKITSNIGIDPDQKYVCEATSELNVRIVNFCQLPNLEVIIPSGSRNFTAFMEDQVGSGRIFELEIDPVKDFWPGGGIRCMTQII